MATKTVTLTANTRPILTQYEDGRCAHSRTPFGAMRAAYTQLLNNRHTHCTVWIPLALLTPFKMTRDQKANLAWARDHSTYIGDAEHVLLARVGIRGTLVRGQDRIETLFYPEICELARVAGLDLALVQAAAHAAAKAKAAEAGRGRAGAKAGAGIGTGITQGV